MSKRNIFIVIALLIGTNIMTGLWALNHTKTESFLIRVLFDTVRLRAYENNDTRMFNAYLSQDLIIALAKAGKEDDIEYFKPLCPRFDNELFLMIEKYQGYKTKDVLLDINMSKPDLYRDIENGKKKIRALCQTK